MNKSDAGKLGRRAVNSKYSEETRREWSRKGAMVLNGLITFSDRSKGGRNQNKKSKALGAYNAAKAKPLTETEALAAEFLGLQNFVKHAIIETEIRPFEVDFAKFEDGEPRSVVEVTSEKSGIKGESIAYKVLKLRERYPKLDAMIVVPQNMEHAGIIALKAEGCGIVFIESIKKELFYE